MDFKNKTVVVTGGGKGIGAACVKTFFDDGANVVSLDIGDDASGIIDERWLSIKCNVAVENEVIAAAEKIDAHFNGIDYLVNNAGIQRYGTVTDTTADEWDQVMTVNLKSYFLCSKYFIPLIQKKGNGVIINIASVQSFVSQKNVAAYTTAKNGHTGPYTQYSH